MTFIVYVSVLVTVVSYTIIRVPTSPGKSWKMILVLESSGNVHFSWGLQQDSGRVLKFILGMTMRTLCICFCFTSHTVVHVSPANT